MAALLRYKPTPMAATLLLRSGLQSGSLRRQPRLLDAPVAAGSNYFLSSPLAPSMLKGNINFTFSPTLSFSASATPGAGVGGARVGGGHSGKQKKGRGEWLKKFYNNNMKGLLDHFNRIGNAGGIVLGCVGTLFTFYSYLFIRDNVKEVMDAMEKMMPFFNKLQKFVRDDGDVGLTISWDEIAEIPVQIERIRKQIGEIKEIVIKLENRKQGEWKEGGEQGKGKHRD